MTLKHMFFVSAMLLFLLPVACGKDSQPAKQSSAQQTASPQPAVPPPSSSTTKTDVWPFASQESSDRAVAENLTARNFLLIFDGSGSMRESECAGSSQKINVAKKAVKAWSRSVPVDANLGLYAFHNQGKLTLPLATSNREAFMKAIDQIEAGGNTPLTQAMLYAYKTFTEQGQRQLGYGEYTIVVVTDGIANSVDDLQRVVDMILAKTPIMIYSIGFCIGENHSLNQPGRTLYRSADNPQQLQEGLQDVLAESEFFDEDAFSK